VLFFALKWKKTDPAFYQEAMVTFIEGSSSRRKIGQTPTFGGMNKTEGNLTNGFTRFKSERTKI
jgi:hypothetical protein